jgi:hypothetical protein
MRTRVHDLLAVLLVSALVTGLAGCFVPAGGVSNNHYYWVPTDASGAQGEWCLVRPDSVDGSSSWSPYAPHGSRYPRLRWNRARDACQQDDLGWRVVR